MIPWASQLHLWLTSGHVWIHQYKRKQSSTFVQCPRELHPTRLFAQPATSLNKNVLSLHGIPLSPFLREHFIRTPAKPKLIVAFDWKLVWRRLKSVSFWPYTTKFVATLSLGDLPYLLNDPRTMRAFICVRNSGRRQTLLKQYYYNET